MLRDRGCVLLLSVLLLSCGGGGSGSGDQSSGSGRNVAPEVFLRTSWIRPAGQAALCMDATSTWGRHLILVPLSGEGTPLDVGLPFDAEEFDDWALLTWLVDGESIDNGPWQVACLDSEGELRLSEWEVAVHPAVSSDGKTVAADEPGLQTTFFWWPDAEPLSYYEALDFSVYEVSLPGGVRATIYEGWFPQGPVLFDAATLTAGGLMLVERARVSEAEGEMVNVLARITGGGGDGVFLDVYLHMPSAGSDPAEVLAGVTSWEDVQDYP